MPVGEAGKEDCGGIPGAHRGGRYEDSQNNGSRNCGDNSRSGKDNGPGDRSSEGGSRSEYKKEGSREKNDRNNKNDKDSRDKDREEAGNWEEGWNRTCIWREDCHRERIGKGKKRYGTGVGKRGGPAGQGQEIRGRGTASGTSSVKESGWTVFQI